MAADALMVTAVNKTYGDKHVVKDISFRAQAGEILGFLGPNGAGKTTTIRMIMGITAPDSGKIVFQTGGRQLAGVPKELVGYLPEERGLYKDACVMHILQFLAGLKNVSRQEAASRARRWLAKFSLADYANAKVEQLSKGMAQKVQFIAAVLHQPRFIVLDEPFAGLDPVSQDLFKAEIKRLAADGAVVLLSSHQMNIVEELCDRIFLINHGQEVVSGRLGEIRERYGSYRVHVELGADADALVRLPAVAGAERLGSGRWVLYLQDYVKPEEFLRQVPSDVGLRELSITRPALHDIFVKIATGRYGG
ncbi:MAG: ATP-binding cassette domain-containing protein [Firmicutes bacterium]|nr:ATP-binding cassette domain-containing protein [Bacillota bacterium]